MDALRLSTGIVGLNNSIIYHLGRDSFPEQLVLHAHRNLPSR